MTTTTAASALEELNASPLYIDTQHEDLVHDVQMDFYGSKMATCSSGKYPTSVILCLRWQLRSSNDALLAKSDVYIIPRYYSCAIYSFKPLNSLYLI